MVGLPISDNWTFLLAFMAVEYGVFKGESLWAKILSGTRRHCHHQLLLSQS